MLIYDIENLKLYWKKFEFLIIKSKSQNRCDKVEVPTVRNSDNIKAKLRLHLRPV